MTAAQIEALLRDAVSRHRAGDIGVAESIYREVLQEVPNNPTACQNLAIILKDRKIVAEAVDLMRRSLATSRLPANFYRNAATVFRWADLPQEAVGALRTALEMNPDDLQCWADFGVSLDLAGQLPEALAIYERTIRLYQPLVGADLGPPPTTRPPDGAPVMELARAHYNRGSVMGRLNRIDESLAEYDRSIAILPCFGEPHRNRAGVNFLRGNMREAWAEYEWRWHCADFPGVRPNYTQPLWDGTELAGKRILLWIEQGFGDTIQFCRYVSLVKARGGRVALICPPELKRLLSSLADVDCLVVQGDRLPEFDVHASLMSLPYLFGTELQTIPAPRTYLRPTLEDVEAWRQRLALDGGAPAVGLVWAGGSAHKADRQRSTPLSAWTPILAMPGIRFYSLQLGSASSQLKLLPPTVFPPRDQTHHIRDFADTAAFIANLDLLISVDTAPAHVAGAIGAEVWTLLAHEPDFRWMCDTDNPSRWYPTMRHFRQSAPGAWKPVFDRVAQELTVWLSRRSG